jgi:hypothetical protein
MQHIWKKGEVGKCGGNRPFEKSRIVLKRIFKKRDSGMG